MAVVHVFYPELWDELRDALRASRLPLDLIVTVADRGAVAAGMAERVAADWPGARVVVMPNRGRDVAPFVHLANAGWLDGYAAVLKLHTKRSPHRPDGDAWRRGLAEGLLGERLAARLAAFEADPDAMLWTADGMIGGGRGAWGVNEAAARSLLARAQVPAPEALRFPAGSMYWLKPLAVAMIRGLSLRHEEFELELSQLDGTLAHAFERALGPIAEAGGHVMREGSDLDARAPARPARAAFVTAVYDPRHREPGADPWLDVAGARPLFEGHAQPALPGPLGFYDPRDPEVLAEQARLAAGAGVDALAVRHHWSHGRARWSGPMEVLLARPDLAFAHHPLWTDEGLEGEPHAPGFEAALARSLVPVLSDRRCAAPGGRPRLLIARAGLMADPRRSVPALREALAALGVGAVEVGVGLADPVPGDLFDLHVEAMPDVQDSISLSSVCPQDFTGSITSCDAIRAAVGVSDPPRAIASVWTGHDDTPVAGLGARVVWGAHPAAFAAALRAASARSSGGAVLIHAWNDWRGGAVIEPSARWGHAWLDVLTAWRGAAEGTRERAA